MASKVATKPVASSNAGKKKRSLSQADRDPTIIKIKALRGNCQIHLE